MWLKLKIISWLLAVALFCGTAFAATFTASLDRDTIMVGETATLSLAFEGAQPRTIPLPGVAGLQITQGGQSQFINNINGVSSINVTVTFNVTATQAGEFTIPALTADVNGQSLTSTPLKLTVAVATAPTPDVVNSGNEVAFMKLIFPKPKIYVGETVIARLEIYLREDVQSLASFQPNSSPADGFSVGKLAELPNQRRRVQIGNHNYTVIPLAVPLTAVRTGTLALGPFTANAVVVLPSDNQGGNPLFRMFNQGEQRQVALATDAAHVQSLPLPPENQPANFNGAVGNFMMTATAGPTTLTVGDPITVRVQISGSGALDSLVLPAQNAWQNFKTFPPTSKLETSDPFGFQGTKTFEQIVSPQNSDVHELPALTFSFFNPEDGKYHTLTQPATPLIVHSAGATVLPTMADAKNQNTENPASPQDILPIQENPGTVAKPSAPLISSPTFLAVQSLPVLAFLAAFVWRKRTDNLANNPRLRRKIAVAKLVQNGITDLRKYAAENKSEEFFALLFRLLQEQLGERLDCPATAITENVIDEHALLRGAPAAAREGLHELFQLCNQARYAPVRGTSELNSVAAQFEKTVGELQEVKA
ncbi:MAG TPA: BatD family protein [Verrucomicrobiae bacterium]